MFLFSFSKCVPEPKTSQWIQWTSQSLKAELLINPCILCVCAKGPMLWPKRICLWAKVALNPLIVQVRINTISVWETVLDKRELACLIRNICQGLIIGKSFAAKLQNLNSHNETDLMSLLFYNNINYNPVAEGSQLERKEVRCTGVGSHSESFPQIQIGWQSHL